MSPLASIIITSISALVIIILCIVIACFKNSLPFTFSRRNPPSPVDLEAQKMEMRREAQDVREISAALRYGGSSSAVSSASTLTANSSATTAAETATLKEVPAKLKSMYLTVPLEDKRGRLADITEQKEKKEEPQVEMMVDPMSFSFGSGKTMAAMYKK